jgi:hypothetical protein
VIETLQNMQAAVLFALILNSRMNHLRKVENFVEGPH